MPCLISAFFSSNLSCCPVQKQNNWVGCNCPFQGLQSKTHSPFQGTCCPCQGFSFFGFGLCLLATCHHLHPGSAITFSFVFFSQWPCCIGCGKGLGPCLPPPLPLPSPAFVLALAPFTGAGPVGSSELSVVSFCSLLLLLEELDSFSLGLDSWYLPGQKNDVGIFVQSRPHFFCDKTWIQKMAKKTSSAEVLTPPHLGLLAVGPSSPAGLARQPNLACKTGPVVLDQNGQWCWIKMGLWSQQHHQWIFGCNRQNHLKQNKWA